MKVNIIPLTLALALPLCAYFFVLAPSNVTYTALQARLALAETEADTLAAGALIRPRVARERAAIAARLVRVRPYTLPQAEAAFLDGVAHLARGERVQLVGVSAKSKAVPLSAAASAPTLPPVPGMATPPAAAGVPSGAGVASAPLGVQSLATGVALERQVTVRGSLDGVVRFLDALGALPLPVNVGNVALMQGDGGLTLTVDCQLVIVDAAQLRDAKRAQLGPALAPHGATSS